MDEESDFEKLINKINSFKERIGALEKEVAALKAQISKQSKTIIIECKSDIDSLENLTNSIMLNIQKKLQQSGLQL